jgi:hypothetical protein
MEMPGLIVDPAAFYDLILRESKIFNSDLRLPQQVFVQGYTNFKFVEFDLMLGPKFWPMLVKCMEVFGDSEISLVVHDPEPQLYFYGKFGRYAAARFFPHSTSEEYMSPFEWEPDSNIAEALMYSADVVAWYGSSLKWGFWGERGLEVGVYATCDPDAKLPVVEGVPLFDVEEIVEDFLSILFKNGQVPRDLAEQLKINYRSVAMDNR